MSNDVEPTGTKRVEVSTELLAEMREWSEPVQVRIEDERDGVLTMSFRQAELTLCEERIDLLLGYLEEGLNVYEYEGEIDLREMWRTAQAIAEGESLG